jgi:serine/threonine protein kinase
MVLERLASCPACGTPVAPGVRFCPTCGQRLAADPPSGPAGGVGAGAAAIDPFLARVRAALIGDYEVSHEIGRGGMAAVFLAKDLRLPRRVALKVMLPELSYSAVMPQRFVGEARTAAMLDHPNIVPVFHAGEQDGLRYFAMRYIDGCSLERLQRVRGPLPVTLACHLLGEIAAALDYAHGQGVVHRDVKPANVMIDRRFGRAIVTDFGIARVADGQRLTNTGLAIGTPEYMSPEQYASEDVTGASDQYALGAVAFHMLAGRPPFTGTQAEVLMAHLREPPPALRALRPDVPEVIETIVARMLAKSPEDRWPSLGELAARFTEHVGSAALALPSQLIALIPDRQADEPAPQLPQTPVSPAAGLRRPPEAPAASPPEPPTPASVAPAAPAPSTSTPPTPGPDTPSAVPSLQATGYTPRGVEPAGALAPEADAEVEPQPPTATISRYTPVAPAYVEPVPPPRDPARRAQRWIVGGVLAAVLAAVAWVAIDPLEGETGSGGAGGPPAGQVAGGPPSTSGGGPAAPPPAPTPAPAGGEVVESDPTVGTAPPPPPVDSPPVGASAAERSAQRRVNISPRQVTVTLPVGDSVRLRAVLADGYGNALSTTEQVQWASSAPAVARVSRDGWVHGIAPGRTARITARIGDVAAARAVRVTAPTTVARGEEAPPPAPASTLTADEAQRQVERLGAAIAARNVDDLRPLLAGPAAPALLEVLRKEKNVQAPLSIGAVQRTGDGVALPVRVDLSWQRYTLGRMNGRHRATVELVAQFERYGDAWRVASVQVPSLTRR